MTPNQSCAIGKNIQAILEQMQIQIDPRKLVRYSLSDVLESIEKCSALKN
ncbi:MAG: hypothetical protein WKF90_10420 [Pyrinomonadaceae bacterium]